MHWALLKEDPGLWVYNICLDDKTGFLILCLFFLTCIFKNLLLDFFVLVLIYRFHSAAYGNGFMPLIGIHFYCFDLRFWLKNSCLIRASLMLFILPGFEMKSSN